MSIRPFHPFPFACSETTARGSQWPAGTEPRLSDVLADPLVHLVMRRDGVSAHALHQIVAEARAGLGYAPHPCCRAA
jgi:hypothetical protein